MAEAQRPRRVDIRHLAHRQRACPHDPAAARHQRDGDGDDHVEHAGAEHRHHRQRQDDQREGHQHVEHALEDEVEPAAEIGRADAQHQADQAADDRGAEADDQRRARAVHQAREDVPAELVGAQQVQPARRLHHGVEVVLLGIERRDPAGQHAGREHHQHEHEPEGAERLAPAEPPDDAQRRALGLGHRLGRRRGDGFRLGTTAVMRGPSREADARVEPGVQHVDHEVGEHEDRRRPASPAPAPARCPGSAPPARTAGRCRSG